MHYQEWLEEWLENYVKPTSKQRTYLRYVELVQLHITPYLGKYEVDALTIDVLQRFVTHLLSCGNLKNHKGLSSNTVCSIINILQNSLKVATYVGHSQNYVADKIKRPSKEEKEITCFTLEEQKAIENAVKDSPKKKLYGILLCFYTGLRIGELLALTWADIDLSKGIIRITKSCHDGKDIDGNYVKVIESPKTRSSKREIPLPKQLIPQQRLRLRDLLKRKRRFGTVLPTKFRFTAETSENQTPRVSCDQTFLCHSRLRMRNGRKDAFGDPWAQIPYDHPEPIRAFRDGTQEGYDEPLGEAIIKKKDNF